MGLSAGQAARIAPRLPAGSGSGFPGAAVLVGAPVGQRAEEARQQVAVRAVQFQPVEAGRGARARGGDELRRDRVHVGARHGARRLVLRRRRAMREAAISGQLPSASGSSICLPSPAGSSPWGRRGRAAGRSASPCMHEVDDAFPGRLLRVVPQAGQPGVMRPVGATQVISVITSAAPPSARAPRCTRWKSPARRRGLYMRHRRDHDAVLQRQAAQRERREHRAASGGTATPRALREPALVAFEPGAVAQAQVLVADALAAREHAST
jgi:hypothetical protein